MLKSWLNLSDMPLEAALPPISSGIGYNYEWGWSPSTSSPKMGLGIVWILLLARSEIFFTRFKSVMTGELSLLSYIFFLGVLWAIVFAFFKLGKLLGVDEWWLTLSYVNLRFLSCSFCFSILTIYVNLLHSRTACN